MSLLDYKPIPIVVSAPRQPISNHESRFYLGSQPRCVHQIYESRSIKATKKYNDFCTSEAIAITFGQTNTVISEIKFTNKNHAFPTTGRQWPHRPKGRV